MYLHNLSWLIFCNLYSVLAILQPFVFSPMPSHWSGFSPCPACRTTSSNYRASVSSANGHILPPLFLCRLLTVILKPLAPPSLSSTGEQMFDAPPPFLSLTTNDQRPSQQKVLAQHCHLLASAMIIGKWCQSYYIICIANEPASIFTWFSLLMLHEYHENWVPQKYFLAA